MSDNAFFEEYKCLDKLCSDMYSCKNGVSEYIAQMESESYQGQFRVASWSSDYKMLKHVRWVRNQIAHETDAYQISKPEDVAFVRDFYKRIFDGQDSLTLLRKSLNAEAGRSRAKNQQTDTVLHAPLQKHVPRKKKTNGWLGVLFCLAALALMMWLFYFNN